MKNKKQITIEGTEVVTYQTKELIFNANTAEKILKDPHLFGENVASYVGRIDFPKFLGGVVEIIHMNNTTVCLAYNPQDQDIQGYIVIHGSTEKRKSTKSLLERHLGATLEFKI